MYTNTYIDTDTDMHKYGVPHTHDAHICSRIQ